MPAASSPRSGQQPGPHPALALLTAAHGGPALAVSLVAALLAVRSDLGPTGVLVVTGAVLAGQLTIGWGNDLRDLPRDRAVGRSDKPLATGALPVRWVVRALLLATAACLALSALLGWRSALVNIVLGAGAGHAYNLGLKATPWSWLPYACAFGTLPSVITLAAADPSWAPWWQTAAGAALGVGAHLLNTLPDLADDERTGVRGLPHRIGPRPSRLLAVVLLLSASVVAVLGPAGQPAAWTWAAGAVVVALAAVAVAGKGRAPFQAAMAIAVLDVVLLVAA
ncbi:UbiA family prenyltransferase [Nocardioides sp. SYSU DS0663]|uniref:UbiA family prenyltransferase n=1 Tax=Nocardioides sp. SYSU DS0663 TaxID=3416445 RepID=UPI003F4CA7D5